MLGRSYRIVLLLLVLAVVVSSCGSNKGFYLKPEKVGNWKHPGHQWKSRHGRPRIYRGNGYWHATPKPQTSYQLTK